LASLRIPDVQQGSKAAGTVPSPPTRSALGSPRPSKSRQVAVRLTAPPFVCPTSGGAWTRSACARVTVGGDRLLLMRRLDHRVNSLRGAQNPPPVRPLSKGSLPCLLSSLCITSPDIDMPSPSNWVPRSFGFARPPTAAPPCPAIR
jgi:hypothetical protein